MDDSKKYSLSQQEIDRAIDWIKTHWKDKKCEVCGKQDWVVMGDLVTPMIYLSGQGVSIGGSSYPQFMTICKNCGNTKYFNALLAKIIENKTEGEDGRK